jgi:RimJ/RimL family protein N-acetyltransferase
LIARLGFKPIGIEHEAFMKNGRRIDIKMYELLKKDYRA